MNARVQVEMKQAVERLPAPTPAAFGTLQRKCACGGSGASSGSSGECPDCKRKKALQRWAAGSTQPDAAPPIVHDVLRSPGQPLDTATRAYFEPRFGHDFSKVRIHADARASESARAVSAVAYTVGHDVVFGAGRHELDTQAGRELLAHELTHVVQQSGAPRASTLRIGSVADPSEREAEAVAAGATKMPTAAKPVSRLVQRQAIGPDSDSNDQTGTDLAAQNQPATSTDSASQSAASGAASDEKPEVCPPPTDMACPPGTAPTTGVSKTIVFPVDSSTLSTAQKADLDAAAATWNSGGASGMVRIDGYASAEYECEYNWRLSCRRAQAAAAELENPSDGSKGVPAANISVFAHGESNAAGKSLGPNRRVTVSLPASPGPVPPPKPEPKPEPAPESPNKCGPDITTALGGVLSSLDPYFSGLTSWQKRRSCMALDVDAPFALVNPIMAWDTRQLFLPNTGWLDYFFHSSGCGSPRDSGCESDDTRGLCEKEGTCGNTVLVGGKCMLAGTANYALYGKMFKLCHDEFAPDFPRADMRAMIWLYKVIPDDPGPPLAMATAAFDGGFPSIPASAENRGSCTGRCGAVRKGSFDFVWEPYKSR